LTGINNSCILNVRLRVGVSPKIMNNPEHVEEVEKTAVKAHTTYRHWLASENALQRTIAKFIEVMKRARE